MIANCDLSVKDEDPANKNMEDMLISDKFFEGIMENYLGVLWHTKVEVLGVANDKEIKFKVEESCEGIISRLHRNKKKYNIKYDFFNIHTS